MKTWQAYRNYRKQLLEDGTVKYLISVDKEDIEVTAEVFDAYAKSDRRERYILYEQSKGRMLSLDQLGGLPPDWIFNVIGSAEDAFHANEQRKKREFCLEFLPKAIDRLSVMEKELLQLLFFEQIPLREIARIQKVPLMTLHYRKQCILKKLRKMFED